MKVEKYEHIAEWASLTGDSGAFQADGYVGKVTKALRTIPLPHLARR